MRTTQEAERQRRRKEAIKELKKTIRRRKREHWIRAAKRKAYRMLQTECCYFVLIALIVFTLILLADRAVCSAKMERGQTNRVAEQETVTKQEIKIAAQNQELTPMELYGCERLTGDYGYPWNTISQDWSADDLEGFWYHDITEDCKAAGGELPPVIQIYTYIICRQYGVDYEMVYALIERESRCIWDARGDGGGSVGLMQIAERWHEERMERLGRNSLENPYTNVLVGVDFLAEIKGKLKGDVPDADLPYYMLAWYNYGYAGAKENLWDKGIVKYEYNEEIMQRAAQLKQEKEGEMQNEHEIRTSE